MAPLVAATALMSNGMTERARTALSRAQRGPAWEAALEHRLFVEVLADAFEGDRDRALQNAERLALLPLPPESPFVRSRDPCSGLRPVRWPAPSRTHPEEAIWASCAQPLAGTHWCIGPCAMRPP